MMTNKNGEAKIGDRNIVWGWVVMILGALSGSILMAWSFDGPFPTPPGMTTYTDLPRRMVRLAHVAFFMLPLINVNIGRDLDNLALSDEWKNRLSWCAIIGMIGIPTGLIMAAAINIHLKYLSVIPVTCLTVALLLMAVGSVKRRR
jgi:hypothetical protein